MKHHISTDGKVRPCRSKGPCPLGSSFDGKVHAVNYANIRNEEMEKHDHNSENKKVYSIEEAKARGEFVNKTVTAQLINKKDTLSIYYNKDTREFEEKRAIAHREILDELHKKYENIPSEGKVVFSAGLPGAGKTTVLNMLKDGDEGVNVEEYATVSSDDFKEILADRGMIPKVKGLDPMEASTLVHGESSHLADQFLLELSQKNKNIVYDFTCKDFESTDRRMNVLKNSGYKENNMQFVFVDIPLETAEKRAIFRYTSGLNKKIESDGNGVGGRFLPPDVLYKNKSETGKYSSVNAEALLNVYNANKENNIPKPIVYDNSGDIFSNPSYKPEKIDFDSFASRGQS